MLPIKYNTEPMLCHSPQCYHCLFIHCRLISRDKQVVEVCSTDLLEKGSEMFDKLVDAPDFEHKWFSDWSHSNFVKFDFDKSHLDPFVDQQMIQVNPKNLER